MLPIVIALRGGRAAARPGQPARSGARARRPALAGRHDGRAADRRAGARDRLAAGDRARHGRDRAAAVHGRRRRSWRPPTSAADEHAAGPDLQRHHVAAQRDRQARLGRGADARGARPDPQPARPTRSREGAAWHDPARNRRTRKRPNVNGRRAQPAGARAEAAPDLSALGVREGAGHSVHVKDLHAYYGQLHSIKGIDLDVPRQRGDRADRSVRAREVDGRALHQPDARGDPRRARRGKRDARRSRRVRPRRRRHRRCAG